MTILHECRMNNVMIKHIYDFNDRDFIFSMPDDMSMYTDGHMMMRMSGNIAEAAKKSCVYG